MNTIALPERFIALLLLLLSETILLRVVPEAVKTPEPSSKLVVPSSIQYLTVSPLDTPAAAKVWKPSTAEPKVIVPVPVVEVVILARLTSFTIAALQT
jgi:hypothetical protein